MEKLTNSFLSYINPQSSSAMDFLSRQTESSKHDF